MKMILKKLLIGLLLVNIAANPLLADDWKDKLSLYNESKDTTDTPPVIVTVEPRTGYMQYIGSRINDPDRSYNKKEIFISRIISGSILSILGIWGLKQKSTYGICSGGMFGLIGINTIINAIDILFEKESGPESQGKTN